MSGTGRATQVALETLGLGNEGVRVTQVAVEALAEDVFPGRVTQFQVQALILGSMAGEGAAATCELWEIRRRDGVVQRFAALDRDVTYAGQVYAAAAPFEATASEQTRSLASGQMEVAGLLSSPSLSAVDLMNGLYDFAEYVVSLVDWSDPSRGVEVKRAGDFGKVSAGETRFTVELLDIARRLDRQVTGTISAKCDTVLGSVRCGIALGPRTRTATVTAVDSTRQFTATGFTEAAGWAAYGLVTMTSGANAGAVRDVRLHGAGGVVGIWQPFFNPVQVGDSFSIVQGCDRRRATCRDVFGNILNFRGFPTLPGNDALFSYPNAR